jgi:hypothetical protein
VRETPWLGSARAQVVRELSATCIPAQLAKGSTESRDWDPQNSLARMKVKEARSGAGGFLV